MVRVIGAIAQFEHVHLNVPTENVARIARDLHAVRVWLEAQAG